MWWILWSPIYFRLKTIHKFKLKGDSNFRFLLFVSFSQSRMDRCFCLLIVCCMFRLDQWKMTGFCAWKCDYVFWWMWILLYYLYLFVFEFQILRRKITQLILWLLLIEVAWNSMPLWFIDVCAHSECLWPNGAKSDMQILSTCWYLQFEISCNFSFMDDSFIKIFIYCLGMVEIVCPIFSVAYTWYLSIFF